MQALLFAKLIKNPHDFLFCFKFLLNIGKEQHLHNDEENEKFDEYYNP